MNERRFVDDRLPRWKELRALLDRAHLRGLSSLSGGDVRRLGSLYRSATTDLAAARSLRLSEATVQHVNRNEGAEVPDVPVVVDGGAARIHAHAPLLQGYEFLDSAGKRIVQAQGHAAMVREDPRFRVLNRNFDFRCPRERGSNRGPAALTRRWNAAAGGAGAGLPGTRSERRK